jgi:hypothetical protein
MDRQCALLGDRISGAISFAVLDGETQHARHRGRANQVKAWGFTISPVWVAIMWAVSIATVWAMLTMQPAQFERYLNQLRLLPLR